MTPEIRKLFDQMREARSSKDYGAVIRVLSDINSSIAGDFSQAAQKIRAAAQHEYMLCALQQYEDTKETNFLTMAEVFAKSCAAYAKKAKDFSLELLAQVYLGGRIFPALGQRSEGMTVVTHVLRMAQASRPDSSEEQDRLLEVIRLARDFIAQNQSSP